MMSAVFSPANSMHKPYAPACDRNREPILAILRDRFANARQVLEIGSGTGQHAVFFARALPELQWQPTEREAMLQGLQLWCDEADLPNLLPPRALDVSDSDWPAGPFDALFTANTLHIMGWSEVEALFQRLPKVLAPDARLLIYGPFNDNGQFTSDSNAAFDAQLKAADPRRGIRDWQAVEALARNIGFGPLERIPMPANNFCLSGQRQR